ncbi:MAG: DUF1882 domain-containing protein [Sulfurovaceae bacterium]
MNIILDALGFNTSHYYIKRPYIVEKISFDNRTFYAKFERINEMLDDTVLTQHLKKNMVIAAPLLENGYTNLLVLEYKGDEPMRFFHTTKQLFNSMDIKSYYVFKGKTDRHLQIFMQIPKTKLDQAHDKLEKISNLLAIKLPVEWRTLPNKNLPEAYNIVTLPYQILEFDHRIK